jgi:hypothetical protein
MSRPTRCRMGHIKGFVRAIRTEGVSGRDWYRRGFVCRAIDARLAAERPVFGDETYG